MHLSSKDLRKSATVNAQNAEDGGLWGGGADVGPTGIVTGAFPDEDTPGKRQAAVAEDGAALRARLVQCLRNYQKRSSCKRSSL
jgi:hypothetical protein